MLINNLLETTSGNTMATSVDYVVHTGHNVQVAILIFEACIARCVESWSISQVLIDEGLVITPERKHEARR